MDKKEIKYGTGFLELLAILFIALKLCGVISWRWVWVLCPLWTEALIVLILAVVAWVWLEK